MAAKASYKVSGNWDKTFRWMKRSKKTAEAMLAIVNKYGQAGVNALSSVTPVDTGATARSWYYETRIDQQAGEIELVWKNSNVVNGLNIALLIQTGHGTRDGAYISGVDYINPALEPIFEQIKNEAWREVIE